MSEITDHSSEGSLDIVWPNDAALEGHQYERVVFENVADQYARGENVTAFFTILQDIKVNPEQDQIGIQRVGTANTKDCLVYAPVQFNPSTASEAVRHGTATFSAASLPTIDDEFYQFCYILNGNKNLGSSLPFLLNCEPDEIDLLSNGPVRKMTSDGLIALADQDNDDILVVHKKSGLTEEKLRQENRHLSDTNRRLELQVEECQTKLELLEVKHKEHINKVNNEIQTLNAARKAANEEILARQQAETKLRVEYDACRSLCSQYQSENIQYAERCRGLEANQAKLVQETNQVRSQWNVQSQFAKEQATQIVDLERRLVEADGAMKASNQRQATLEREVRDCRLTAEKGQLTIQAQLEDFQRQTAQRDDEINALESKNQLLKDELVSAHSENECLALEVRRNKDLIQDLQEQLDRLEEQNQEKNEFLQHELELLRKQLHEKKLNSEAYNILKTSCEEIGKRCVKYQKSDIGAKRQLAAYKNTVSDLERQIHDLTERLSAGAEEYKILFRKYTKLEQSSALDRNQIDAEPFTTTAINNDVIDKKEVELVLRNTYDNNNQDEEEQLNAVLRNVRDNGQYVLNEEQEQEQQQSMRNLSAHSSLATVDSEVRHCPVCNWEFPKQMNVEGKREHVESHFQ